MKGSAALERLVLLVAWPGVSSDPGHYCLGHKFFRVIARLKSFGCFGISYTLYCMISKDLLTSGDYNTFIPSGRRIFHVQ